MADDSPIRSDLELFTRELNWDTRPVLSKLYSPGVFGALGFGLACIANAYQKRPVMSGVQKHIAFTALGVPLGLFVQKKLDERHAIRDAKLIHYMQLHPEHFPPKERIKYKDVLQPWIPMR